MPANWAAELSAAAQREFGPARAEELAANLGAAAAALAEVLATPLEPTETPPYLAPVSYEPPAGERAS